jgi:transposase
MFSGHLSLQLVDLRMEHQVNGFMGCDYNIERLINRCKQFRRIATRYEKRAANYKAMWLIAATVLWLKVA